jgi:hypothetical protein
MARARAQVRRHARSLLHLRPGGFPWPTVAGKRLTGWIVIDIDATIILLSSKKTGSAVTFEKTWWFHPLACCTNTQESLSMQLRPGNAVSDTVADHLPCSPLPRGRPAHRAGPASREPASRAVGPMVVDELAAAPHQLVSPAGYLAAFGVCTARWSASAHSPRARPPGPPTA